MWEEMAQQIALKQEVKATAEREAGEAAEVHQLGHRKRIPGLSRVYAATSWRFMEDGLLASRKSENESWWNICHRLLAETYDDAVDWCQSMSWPKIWCLYGKNM